MNKLEGNLTDEDLLNTRGIMIGNRDADAVPVCWQDSTSAYYMVFPELRFNINDSENEGWIQGLQKFIHLKDISQLRNLKGLYYLNLRNNRIRDISI